jgi:hypothetical protein
MAVLDFLRCENNLINPEGDGGYGRIVQPKVYGVDCGLAILVCFVAEI